MRVVLICGDGPGSRAAFPPEARALPALPGRGDVDPVLDAVPLGDPGASRLVVAGDDAALAAVLQRLLRRERLDVALALVPAHGSVAAGVWGLPTDPGEALALALDGAARPAPLVRDDRGGVAVGRHRVTDLHGEVYADEHRVWSGDAALLEVGPDPAGAGTRVRVVGPRRLLGARAGHEACGAGRAVQLGCRPTTVVRDGLPDERTLTRRSWYRHTDDWWLVRPDPTITPGAG